MGIIERAEDIIELGLIALIMYGMYRFIKMLQPPVQQAAKALQQAAAAAAKAAEEAHKQILKTAEHIYKPQLSEEQYDKYKDCVGYLSKTYGLPSGPRYVYPIDYAWKAIDTLCTDAAAEDEDMARLYEDFYASYVYWRSMGKDKYEAIILAAHDLDPNVPLPPQISTKPSMETGEGGAGAR